MTASELETDVRVCGAPGPAGMSLWWLIPAGFGELGGSSAKPRSLRSLLARGARCPESEMSEMCESRGQCPFLLGWLDSVSGS